MSAARSAPRLPPAERLQFGLRGRVIAAAQLIDERVARCLVRRLNAPRDAVAAADDVGADGALVDDEHDEVGSLTLIPARVRANEQARTRFVATASHELRTPLASLRLMLGLLEEDLDTDAPDLTDARRQVARAAAQADRMSRLANDLLDLSRLDADLAPRDEPVDLRDLAQSVVAEFEDFPRGAVALEPKERSAGRARGDPGAVAQILRILLDNALRFAPAGTAVTVALHGAGRRRLVHVRDAGPGVAPRDRERIFGRFERGGGAGLDANRTATISGRAPSDGFGLGLAIGRELARGMGGELRLTSPGAPTCFTLELPAADLDAVAARAPHLMAARAGRHGAPATKRAA